VTALKNEEITRHNRPCNQKIRGLKKKICGETFKKGRQIVRPQEKAHLGKSGGKRGTSHQGPLRREKPLKKGVRIGRGGHKDCCWGRPRSGGMDRERKTFFNTEQKGEGTGKTQQLKREGGATGTAMPLT